MKHLRLIKSDARAMRFTSQKALPTSLLASPKFSFLRLLIVFFLVMHFLLCFFPILAFLLSFYCCSRSFCCCLFFFNGGDRAASCHHRHCNLDLNLKYEFDARVNFPSSCFFFSLSSLLHNPFLPVSLFVLVLVLVPFSSCSFLLYFSPFPLVLFLLTRQLLLSPSSHPQHPLPNPPVQSLS